MIVEKQQKIVTFWPRKRTGWWWRGTNFLNLPRDCGRASAKVPWHQKRRLPVLKTFKGLGVKISPKEKLSLFSLIHWQSKILVKTRLNKTKTLNAMFTFWWEALSSCGGMAYLSSVTPSLLQLLHLWLDLKSRRVLLPNSPKSTFHNSCCNRHWQSKN